MKILFLLACATVAWGQISTSTARRIVYGAALPATCSPSTGDVYFINSGAIGVYYCSAANTWTAAATGGGGAPLAGSGSFSVVRTSNTVLTIGPSCTASAPCVFAFGTTTYSLTSSATATIATGTDAAYIYLSDTGTLTVGTNTQTVTCSGCTAVTGITAFPATAISLWYWVSASGVWASGGTNNQIITQKGADPQAYYLINRANTQLKNGVNLGALTTGLVKISVSGGVATPSSISNIRVLPIIIDGGGSAITTGVKGDLQVPFACTISSWTLLADQSGSIVVDVWKDTYANYPPTGADTITASAKPTISTATKNTSTTLTGWTTSVTAGDTLRFNVDSASTVTRVTLQLECGQ